MPILNNPDLIEISGKFFNIVWILIKKEESFSSAIGSRYLSTHAVEPFLEQRTTIVSFKITITSSKTFPVDSLSTESLIQSTLMTLQVLITNQPKSSMLFDDSGIPTHLLYIYKL
jgi:hypothetical protein